MGAQAYGARTTAATAATTSFAADRHDHMGAFTTGEAFYQAEAPTPRLATLRLFRRANSRLSTIACRLASTMLSLTPTVPHSDSPSLDSMRTRVRAAVPLPESMMRTL